MIVNALRTFWLWIKLKRIIRNVWTKAFFEICERWLHFSHWFKFYINTKNWWRLETKTLISLFVSNISKTSWVFLVFTSLRNEWLMSIVKKYCYSSTFIHIDVFKNQSVITLNQRFSLISKSKSKWKRKWKKHQLMTHYWIYRIRKKCDRKIVSNSHSIDRKLLQSKIVLKNVNERSRILRNECFQISNTFKQLIWRLTK